MSDSPEAPREHIARRDLTPAGGVFRTRAGHRR
ncbi:hypothetical protein J2S43_004602 [Catenuloplanes nepalensis]|uniref:Uncharacterized protein n=1 Tax=Catenuloplanes nepalensis TaxID=587533 RepID=A0ABT9MXD3_9ACTN|nr:hypothetical protein [Catenuloplanes nepalensis]